MEKIRFLIFDIMGMMLGVDVEQVSGMLFLDEARERHLDMIWFHEKLPLPVRQARYGSPRVLLVKGRPPPFGVIIDRPEDIRTIPLAWMSPVPCLIETCMACSALWGVADLEGYLVLLVDLYKLAA